MGSMKAKKVALKVIESIGKKKQPTMGQIIRDVGYAPTTSLNPQQVTTTKAYQDTVEPFLNKLIKERDRIIKAMSEKELDEVAYNHLTDAMDKATKNIQLLSGGDTEKQNITINIDGDANNRYVKPTSNTEDSGTIKS